MTDRTWTGAQNNNARNPNNWSPTGVPEPGDTLSMQSGTMNIRDDNLAGDTLVFGQPYGPGATATLNLSHHATASLDVAVVSDANVTVNVKGSDTLNLHNEFPSSGRFTVNLRDHASLTGTFNLVFSSVDVEGGACSRLDNASGSFTGSFGKFDTRVEGQGGFTVGTAQSVGGQLEFGDSVSCGQSVGVTGDPFREVVSHVQIDQPDAFKGAVSLNVFGEVDLQGLTNADSYTFQNDMLSIYSGSTVLDTLRLTAPPLPSGLPSGQNFDLAVYRTQTGVAIDRGSIPSGGTMLPVHM